MLSIEASRYKCISTTLRVARSLCDADTENVLKCVICNKTFSLKIAFLKHLKRHSVPIIESTQGNHQKDDSPEESHEIDESSNKEEEFFEVPAPMPKKNQTPWCGTRPSMLEDHVMNLTFLIIYSLFFQYSTVNTAIKYTKAGSPFTTMYQKLLQKVHVQKYMSAILLQTQTQNEP